ncbi:hypothetical protein KKA14_17835, partial [bacterium]|nr:hypothetical protein [bacterium]
MKGNIVDLWRSVDSCTNAMRLANTYLQSEIIQKKQLESNHEDVGVIIQSEIRGFFNQLAQLQQAIIY